MSKWIKIAKMFGGKKLFSAIKVTKVVPKLGPSFVSQATYQSMKSGTWKEVSKLITKLVVIDTLTEFAITIICNLADKSIAEILDMSEEEVSDLLAKVFIDGTIDPTKIDVSLAALKDIPSDLRSNAAFYGTCVLVIRIAALIALMYKSPARFMLEIEGNAIAAKGTAGLILRNAKQVFGTITVSNGWFMFNGIKLVPVKGLMAVGKNPKVQMIVAIGAVVAVLTKYYSSSVETTNELLKDMSIVASDIPVFIGNGMPPPIVVDENSKSKNLNDVDYFDETLTASQAAYRDFDGVIPLELQQFDGPPPIGVDPGTWMLKSAEAIDKFMASIPARKSSKADYINAEEAFLYIQGLGVIK